jgi:Tfp pilus assembly protein FimT
MVELIIVICVMGIVATLAMSHSVDRTSLHEIGFRDQLKAMLRHARKLAVSQQRNVCVLLGANQANGVYANGIVCNPATPIAEPGNNTPFVLAAPPGVVIGGPAAVQFDKTGQPVPNADQVINVGTQVFTISRDTGIAYP